MTHRASLENVYSMLTGSIPTILAFLLCVFLMARATPVSVPPVPAPAKKASTFPEEGYEEDRDGMIIAVIISGPVVSS